MCTCIPHVHHMHTTLYTCVYVSHVGSVCTSTCVYHMYITCTPHCTRVYMYHMLGVCVQVHVCLHIYMSQPTAPVPKAGHPKCLVLSVLVGMVLACLHVHVCGFMGFSFLLTLFSWCAIHVCVCVGMCTPVLCEYVSMCVHLCASYGPCTSKCHLY